MGVDALRETLPEYAKDISLNLSSVMMQVELSEVQAWGTALACAINTRCDAVINAVTDDASQKLSPTELNGARTAAALMAMNNVFYRFGYLSGDNEFATMPARLRMNSLRSHGVDTSTFELWCLAVSAANGCGRCVESHWKQLQEHEVSRDVALAAIRIASVIQAAAVSTPR